MNESLSENVDSFPIQYLSKLEGTLSSEFLVEETHNLYHECLLNKISEKRSETLFLKTIISWEEKGECTMEDLSILLGWYFGDSEDISWKKAWGILSQRQKESLGLPKWITTEGPYSAYSDNGFSSHEKTSHWSKARYSRY